MTNTKAYREEHLHETSSASVAPGKALFRRPWVLLLIIFSILALLGSAAFLARWTKIRALTAACNEAVRANDWRRLEELSGQLYLWQPGTAAPIIFMAEAANRQGRFDDAATLLEQLPDDDPMTPPALLEGSHLLFGPLNRPIDGARMVERALRSNPRLCEARRRLIYFYAFTLQRRKMVEHAHAAIEHDCDLPETYIYLFSQDYLSFANAFEENSRWLASNPDEELFLVARAIYRITSKALDETEDPAKVAMDEASGVPVHKQVLARLFERFPDNIELIAYFLGEASTNGDAQEVARLLSQAPPSAAEDNRFWRYMGWLHCANEKWLEAERCYQKALLINPYDYVTQHQLAGVERRLNHPDQVITLETLAREGQLLRREILQLPNVTSAPPSLLTRMANYAAACGDDRVANKLYSRVQVMTR